MGVWNSQIIPNLTLASSFDLFPGPGSHFPTKKKKKRYIFIWASCLLLLERIRTRWEGKREGSRMWGLVVLQKAGSAAGAHAGQLQKGHVPLELGLPLSPLGPTAGDWREISWRGRQWPACGRGRSLCLIQMALGSHWRILSRRVTWYNECFRKVILAAVPTWKGRVRKLKP